MTAPREVWMPGMAEPHPHGSAPPHVTDETHWAKLDETGRVIHVCVCEDEMTARSLGYSVIVNGTHAGLGWTTTDGGATWTDTRDPIIILGHPETYPPV